MKFKSILIVTYGRSGSTLLMGVLNSIPGVVIRGENMNICFGLYSAYKSLIETKDSQGQHTVDSTLPFYGADQFDAKTFLEDARRLLKHQLIPENSDLIKCWGFKEIRYTENISESNSKYELKGYLNFLSKLFDTPAFIFLTRKHEDVATSAFWQAEEKSEAINAMLLFENEASDWSDKRSDCFWIDYSNIVARDAKFVDIFEFLGEEYDSELIEKVLQREHSYGGKKDNLLNVSLRDYQQIKIDNTISERIKVVHIDELPSRIDINEAFDISGVIIPSSDNQVTTILIENCETKPKIKANLPSPWFGEKHIDNSFAAHSRFQITGVKLSPDTPILGYIEFADGNKELVFKISI